MKSAIHCINKFTLKLDESLPDVSPDLPLMVTRTTFVAKKTDEDVRVGV